MSSTLDEGAPAEAALLAPQPGTYTMIPYVHVADLTRSIDFYLLLGFELEQTHDADGVTVWASMRNAESRLFLILADAPIDAGAQAVQFYLWTRDVGALREHLIANRVPVRPVIFPPYMKGGEIRITDPDGYVLSVGQREAA